MKNAIRLHAERIDYGRSEIWLEADGKELTPRRRLATNEVISVTQRHCTPEVFQAFHTDYHTAVGQGAALDISNLHEVATELGLKT